MNPPCGEPLKPRVTPSAHKQSGGSLWVWAYLENHHHRQKKLWDIQTELSLTVSTALLKWTLCKPQSVQLEVWYVPLSLWTPAQCLHVNLGQRLKVKNVPIWGLKLSLWVQVAPWSINTARYGLLFEWPQSHWGKGLHLPWLEARGMRPKVVLSSWIC